MKNIILISLLILFVIISSCKDSSKISFNPSIVQTKTSADIFISNNTKFPISITKDYSYNNLENGLYISKKIRDTLNIDIDGYEQLYISHKNILEDTILIGYGDILTLEVFEDDIKYEILDSVSMSHKHFKTSKKIYKDVKYIQLNKKVDSTTKLFYEIDINGKPLVGNNDFQKFINYPVNINRKALKEKEVEKKLLAKQMKELYEYEIKYYNEQKTSLPLKIIELLKFKSQASYHKKSQIFHRRSNSDAFRKVLDSDTFINEKLLDNPYAKSVLYSYLIRNVIKSKPEYSRSTQYINYKEAFDSVPNYLNDSLSKFARFLSIEAMINFGESFKNVKSKFNEFENLYNDSRLNSILDKKYLFNINKFDSIKAEIKLVNKDIKVSSLKSILEKYTGNLIYIDFWASWCAPCREVMPESLELIEELTNKKIVYVYLSIDNDVDKWTKASRAEEIYDYPLSYKILNYENADFLKQIDLKTIPRYILIDKNGKMINENAPGPKGNPIRELLIKSLK